MINQYQNQYQQQYQQQYQPYYSRYNNTQPNTNIEYVNGLSSVQAMPLPPNCIRLFLDSELKQFYIKRTDFEGRATIQVYPYTDSEAQKSVEFVTVEQFDALKKEIENLKNSIGAKNE